MRRSLWSRFRLIRHLIWGHYKLVIARRNDEAIPRPTTIVFYSLRSHYFLCEKKVIKESLGGAELPPTHLPLVELRRASVPCPPKSQGRRWNPQTPGVPLIEVEDYC